MSISEIGCCGAYCRTCSAFIEQTCKGWMKTETRDILKAKMQDEKFAVFLKTTVMLIAVNIAPAELYSMTFITKRLQI